MTRRDPVVRPLERRDVAPITAAFRDLGPKPRSQYERYLSEQREGSRSVLVAFVEGDFAGYVTIDWDADHLHFRKSDIPEIQDLNVLPRFRRAGIGTRLMNHAELAASERSSVVGIGAGMSPDYGVAQRLYARRGYVPDGRGLASGGRRFRAGKESWSTTISPSTRRKRSPKGRRTTDPPPTMTGRGREPRLGPPHTPSQRGLPLLPARPPLWITRQTPHLKRKISLPVRIQSTLANARRLTLNLKIILDLRMR